jgi:YD repeat-containing protein
MKALGCVWEYDYTSYGDVKRVKDPEGGTVAYEYDYELGEPAYGQVRRVIDALGRATEYAYYGADDTNLARRGQVKRVTVPGGYWREMDYGGAGWLVRREVQTTVRCVIRSSRLRFRFMGVCLRVGGRMQWLIRLGIG